MSSPNFSPVILKDKMPQITNKQNVYSGIRTVQSTSIELHEDLKPNTRMQMEGLKFLGILPVGKIQVAFFDPQYRGVLDNLSYGNEGVKRGQKRAQLRQMSEAEIAQFIQGIARALIPTGHLFLWMDKFHLCQGFKDWFAETNLNVVDLISWDKDRIGMGYRTRRSTEYLVVLQKRPCKAKGVWKIHNIPDTWREKIIKKDHPHTKPIKLQGELIRAVSDKGDYVIDPASGSFSVMKAAMESERIFLGCDVKVSPRNNAWDQGATIFG